MYSKTELFDEALQRLALWAKALSHPARLAIVRLLAQRQTCIAGDIAPELPGLSRTTVSQHLQELKSVGIIQGDIQGNKICYCLDGKVLSVLQSDFKAFFEALPPPPACGDGCC